MFKTLKLDSPANLAKAAALISTFLGGSAESLEKSFSFHKGMAAHHTALAEAHTAHATTAKAVHDSLPDNHEMKNCMGKSAGHHEAMAAGHGECAKAHTAQADCMKASLDSLKAMDSEFEKAAPAGDPANPTPAAGDAPVALPVSIDQALAKLIADSQGRLIESPEMKKKVDDMVMAQFLSKFGNVTIPTEAAVNPRTVVPGRAAEDDGRTAVPRYGQQDPTTAATARKAVEPILQEVLLGPKES